MCGMMLSRTNPYAHYNNSNAECFGRLFEGMGPDDMSDDDDFDDMFEFV